MSTHPPGPLFLMVLMPTLGRENKDRIQEHPAEVPRLAGVSWIRNWYKQQ